MSNQQNPQLQPQWDEPLLRTALKKWSPDAVAKVIDVLSGGYSGAAALLIDVEQNRKNSDLLPGELRSGEYVLKLDVNRPREGSDDDEAQRHLTASTWSEEFAAEHIPPLKQHFHTDDRIALLYEIAGKAFTRLTRSDLIPLGPLEIRLRRFSEKLLANFNTKATVNRDNTIKLLMSEWLTWRIDPAQAPVLYGLAESIAGSKRAFVKSLQILANPIMLIADEFAKKPMKATFHGMLHGDLHQENVFWDRPSNSQKFWIIDFALARSGPLLFDHAYFELSLLLRHFETVDIARFLSFLDAFRHSSTEMGARFIAQQDEGIRSLTEAFRQGIIKWQEKEQELRADGVAKQWCLARVAAGLNWANKRIDGKVQLLSFHYAAHAATEYLQRFHSSEWDNWARDVETPQNNPKLSGTAGTINNEWLDFWREMSAFSESEYYVLIAGPLGQSQSLAAFGQLPWSAVIDFDPDSDTNGLLRYARTNLERNRGFHFFGRIIPSISLTRGVAWMMAGGASTLGEAVPTGLSDWRPLYKQSIRTLAVELRKQTAPATVRILVIPGTGSSHPLLVRALEEIVDELGVNRHVTVVTDGLGSQEWKISEVTTVLNIAVEELSQRVAAVFGVASDPQVAMVPGVNGPTALNLEKIRNFDHSHPTENG